MAVKLLFCRFYVAFLCSSHLTFPSTCFVSVHVVHRYSSLDTATVWEKSRFILSERSDLDRILSGDITPGQSGPGRNGDEGVHRIPQS